MLPREARPLLIGLAAAVGSVAVLVSWPAGGPWRELGWASSLLIVALSLWWFERRMGALGQPMRPIRWVAGGLAAVVMAQFLWILAQRIVR